MLQRPAYVVGSVLVALSSWCQGAEHADLLITHAKVVTLVPESPEAEALAVRDRKIFAVGSTADLERLRGPRTKVIDAQGRLLLPGFNDSHVHFVRGGEQLSSVQLRDARTPDEFRRRIGDYAARQKPGVWITGGDWDHEHWPGTPLPVREWIDEVTPAHPVFVHRLDGHMGLANSLALRLAGVTRETPDPAGGLIVRDADGEPTGVLKDAAMNLVLAKIPERSHEELLEAARAATNHAARLGVTSVHDLSGSQHVLFYEQLLKSGALRTRIYVAAPLPRWQDSQRKGLRAAVGSEWLRQGLLKGFADGSLGSSTALFFDPYFDAPDVRGLPSDEMVPPTAMEANIRGAHAAGLQVAVHAIGDRANHQVLTFFEQIGGGAEPEQIRFRIEHAQHLRAEDIPRFGRAKIIASMQPYHCADDGRWAEKKIGPRRAEGTYAFRSLLDSGAVLAFGSDWNVAPLDPLVGIAAAVTRRTLDGRHPDGWVPEQKISVLEAVRAYTIGSAYAEFQEARKGTLEPGKLADFVLLSRDIFTIPATEIEQARVVLTVVGGQVVYSAESLSGPENPTLPRAGE